MERFVNLHSHTCGSHLDAIIRVEALFKRVKELGQTAVAVTDHGNMSSMYEAYRESQKTGIKLIPGNEIYFVEDLEDKKSKRRHLVLLATNAEGYKNLLCITAEGFRNYTNIMGKQYPRVDAAILQKYNKGIVATSACGGSIIAAHIFKGEKELARKAASIFKDIFGDRFYLELQPHDLSRGDFSQELLNDQLKEIAAELEIETVTTCDSHYLTKRHEKYHAMILAIGSKKLLEDPKRHRYDTLDPCVVCNGSGKFSPNDVDSEDECYACQGIGGDLRPCAEFYLKSEEELIAFFTKRYGRAYAESMIENTGKIADMCEPPDYMEPKGNRLPVFDPSDQEDFSEFKVWQATQKGGEDLPLDLMYLRYKCWLGFRSLCKDFDHETKQVYWNRVKSELEVYEGNKFCSYMLIVYDVLNWSRKQGYFVGLGRGSVGGSLVALLLGIHQADPIRYGLLFERFLNKFKKSLPDIDMDFAPSAMPSIMSYIKDRYGTRHVARISNIVRITPKVAIKDISRSLPVGGDKSTAFRIANEVTSDIPTILIDKDGNRKKIDTMEKALEVSKKLQVFVHQYPEVLDYANEIVGLPRSFSVHAAGVIIADVPLDEYIPLRCDKDGEMITQYEKDACEENGLIKLDFLGIDTLDVLRETWEGSKQIGIDLPHPDDIPEGDELSFKLIQSGNVKGCFQLEGHTMTPLCKPFRPQNIEDLAMINAIGRPSLKKEQRVDFINRRFGKAKRKAPHKKIESILEHTYGVAVYEEDLQHIAREIAGWDYTKGDGLRKLTKLKEKGAELAIKLEADFIGDAMAHSGMSKTEATDFWNAVIIPFSKYGFNKSHAIFYGTMGYRTAYYKTHARAPFFCALLNSETKGNKSDRAESIDGIKREARRFKIKIEACDINLSKHYYTIKDKSTLVTGLGAIKGLGQAALNYIIAGQPYTSFPDFLARVPSAVNKRMIQVLAKAGAFDSFGISRKFAFERYDVVRKAVKSYVKKLGDEFFFTGDRTKPLLNYLSNFTHSAVSEESVEWSMKEKLLAEKEVLGEYISGSVTDLFPGFFRGGMYEVSFAQINRLTEGTSLAMEGVVQFVTELKIKKPGRNFGRTMARVTVETLRGDSVEVTMWPGDYDKYEKVLGPDVAVRGMFKVNEFNGSKSLILSVFEKVSPMQKEST